MAVKGKISSGFLYRRKIQKIAGGAIVDWNSKPVVDKLEKAIAMVNERGAKRVVRKARSIIKQRAYETGDLYRSIKAVPSRYQYSASISLHGRIYTEWLIWAGNDQIDYAMHVETGRYFEKSGTRIPAVPFMRQAAADTRKWLRPRMRDAIERALK